MAQSVDCGKLAKPKKGEVGTREKKIMANGRERDGREKEKGLCRVLCLGSFVILFLQRGVK